VCASSCWPSSRRLRWLLRGVSSSKRRTARREERHAGRRHPVRAGRRPPRRRRGARERQDAPQGAAVRPHVGRQHHEVLRRRRGDAADRRRSAEPRRHRREAAARLGQARTACSDPNLLNHTSGDPELHGVRAGAKPGVPQSARRDPGRRLIAPALQFNLAFKPGSRAEYSNTNSVLLGEIVQRITKKALRDLAVFFGALIRRRLVTKPLLAKTMTIVPRSHGEGMGCTACRHPAVGTTSVIAAVRPATSRSLRRRERALRGRPPLRLT
jgi:Beta-lactamase